MSQKYEVVKVTSRGTQFWEIEAEDLESAERQILEEEYDTIVRPVINKD